MKKYFIDSHITYCYPYEVDKPIKNHGVLSKYIGKYYTRDEIDKIICELVMRHPYVERAMRVKVNVMWKQGNTSGYYYILDFENDNYNEQDKGSLEIKYEK